MEEKLAPEASRAAECDLGPGRCREQTPSSLTFPLQLIAVPQELQRVRLIGGLDVIHVDVQVIGGVQEVVRQQGALALVQGDVDLRGHQRLSLAVGSVEVQCVGRGCGETGKQKQNKKQVRSLSFSSSPLPDPVGAAPIVWWAHSLYLVNEKLEAQRG